MEGCEECKKCKGYVRQGTRSVAAEAQCRRSSPESRNSRYQSQRLPPYGTTVKLAARHNPAHRQSKDEKRDEAVDEERLALVTIPKI